MVYIRKVQDSRNLLDGDDQELHLIQLRQEDSGWYSCVVENPFGFCVSFGYLNVTQPLEDPDTRFPILDIMLDLFYSFIF